MPACWPVNQSVLILDEPLAGLDAASQQGLLNLLTISAGGPG